MSVINSSYAISGGYNCIFWTFYSYISSGCLIYSDPRMFYSDTDTDTETAAFDNGLL